MLVQNTYSFVSCVKEKNSWNYLYKRLFVRRIKFAFSALRKRKFSFEAKLWTNSVKFKLETFRRLLMGTRNVSWNIFTLYNRLNPSFIFIFQFWFWILHSFILFHAQHEAYRIKFNIPLPAMDHKIYVWGALAFDFELAGVSIIPHLSRRESWRNWCLSCDGVWWFW